MSALYKTNTAAMISIMQAYINGQLIEAQHRDGGAWVPATEPAWDWDTYNYRVAARVTPYRRYLRRLSPTGSYMQQTLTCGLTHKTDDSDDVSAIEALVGFERWIDTKWQES